ncbi:MAG TPA: PEP-CTERM sorting domain-containing protein [Verrucomicrobiae bacterium]|nr:PEP-CTERM sorting domain-containing protein [Verrucomicrobiae bacterium]
MKLYKFAVLNVVTIVSLTSIAPAAVVDWGLGAQSITGTNDVSNIGTLVNAFNLGPSGVQATTVNGVTFSAFAFPNSFSTDTITHGNYTFAESFGSLTTYNTTGSGSAPFSNLPSEYATLLSSSGSSGNPDTLSLTISGLVTDQEYLFQWWANDSSLSTLSANGFHFSTTASTDDSTVTLDDNIGNANGGLGQFVTGRFIADGEEQVINFNGVGNDDPALNAFQIRAVPEPSGLALAGIGAAAFAWSRNRRKRA